MVEIWLGLAMQYKMAGWEKIERRRGEKTEESGTSLRLGKQQTTLTLDVSGFQDNHI